MNYPQYNINNDNNTTNNNNTNNAQSPLDQSYVSNISGYFNKNLPANSTHIPDLSSLSDNDLKAYYNNDHSSISDDGLKNIYAYEQYQNLFPSLQNDFYVSGKALVGDALTGIQQTEQLPFNVAHYLGNQKVKDFIDNNPYIQALYHNYYNDLGVKPNFVDNLVSSALPFGAASKLVGLAKYASPLSKAAATGGLYGFASNTNDDNGMSGLLGLGIGAATDGAANLASKGVNAIANWYGKSMLPGLISQTKQEMMAGIKNPNYYADKLKEIYSNANTQNNNNWSALDNQALKLDSNAGFREIPNNFDNSDYKNFINNYIENYSNMEPAIGSNYSNAADFAQNEGLRLAPQSFSGVVALRQNLNRRLRDFFNKNNLTQGDWESQNFVTRLKDISNNNLVNNNSGLVGTQDFNTFKQLFSDANSHYSNLQNFYNTTDALGNPVYSNEMETALKSKNPLDAAYFNNFIPSGQQTRFLGYNNLSNLFGGDNRTAADAIKSYLFRTPELRNNIFESYRGMPTDQQKFLFGGTSAEPYLDASNQAVTKYGFPKDQSQSKIGKYFSPIGLAGYLGSRAAGVPWTGSALAGWGLGLGQKALQSQIANRATPELMMKIIHRPPTQLSPTYLNYLLNSSYKNIGNQNGQ